MTTRQNRLDTGSITIVLSPTPSSAPGYLALWTSAGALAVATVLVCAFIGGMITYLKSRKSRTGSGQFTQSCDYYHNTYYVRY